jgi:hypothetical protein
MVVKTVDKHMKTQCSKYAIRSMLYYYAFQIKKQQFITSKGYPLEASSTKKGESYKRYLQKRLGYCQSC